MISLRKRENYKVTYFIMTTTTTKTLTFKDMDFSECQEILDRHSEVMKTVINAASDAVKDDPTNKKAHAFLRAAVDYYASNAEYEEVKTDDI